tara:strand:+ start:466 stop:1158 length:693 start_codon:yes stop_codon:yes gene_type:complete
MPLFGLHGPSKEINQSLVRLAIQSTPAIFLDSAECTNIHLFPDISTEKFNQLYIVPGESLYRFKPTLLKLSSFAKQIGTNQIFISTSNHLFDYDNKKETEQILTQCWAIINWLANNFQVTVGIIPNTLHDQLSKKYQMGHTIWSQRINSDLILNELQQFGKALSIEDRIIFSQLIQKPLKHLGSITYVSSQQTWAFLLLSILIEQQKIIMKNERLVNGHVSEQKSDNSLD